MLNLKPFLNFATKFVKEHPEAVPADMPWDSAVAVVLYTMRWQVVTQ